MDADVDVDVRVCGGETSWERGGVWCERREGEIEEKIDLRGKRRRFFILQVRLRVAACARGCGWYGGWHGGWNEWITHGKFESRAQKDRHDRNLAGRADPVDLRAARVGRKSMGGGRQGGPRNANATAVWKCVKFRDRLKQR